MAIGRPIKLTPNLSRKMISVTAPAGQTSFTVTGGYRINELAVFRNGVRLSQGNDFTATDGSTVTLLSGANLDDNIEFQVFDSFNLADAITSGAADQVISGNLTVSGTFTGGSVAIQSGGTGIGVATAINFIGAGDTVIESSSGVIDVKIGGEFDSVLVGSAVTINSTGVDAGAGIISATTFQGSGANLTNLSGTAIASGTVAAARVATLNQNTTGTAGGLSGTPNITDGFVTATGTLTYEDVTNVDSVGIVTARGGLEIGAAGVGGTISAVGNTLLSGISTFVGFSTFKNDVYVAGVTTSGSYVGRHSDVPKSGKTGAHVLVATDAGQCISITTGGVTVNNSVFAAGDVVSIYNDSGSSQTITQGTGVTLRKAGSSTTGNLTLQERGMITIWFKLASEAIVSGNLS